ncbi:hypothetical protein O4J56_28870 [Nocardiopsis sp. RSe5-2]|uniref:Lipoprotein n=1 Tax=Nocardiopsis endophytica TaxID=3018445 RepID=A0ABT4UCJ9_9ACTN|nr:hypothetical protein [Nocardiopsis endophytica]MDA2814691.1 hypothetical protein [Nocardiopsis endophytica]
MRRTLVLAPPLLAASVALAACSGGTSGEEEPSPSPSPTPVSDEERITQVTKLELPEDAAGLTLTENGETPDEDAPRPDEGELGYILEAAFTTTPKGAEAFCGGPGMGVYTDSEGPSADLLETFGMDEADADTVDGSTHCRGAETEEGKVQREVLVLYPDEETASVHVMAYAVE